VGKIPRVSARLKRPDHWGTFKARWGVGRMHYLVDPGLYAVGAPGPESPVLVTANYKMSFDCLRSALADRCAWILVLDTQGVNVWCAAGKGTFATQELIERIRTSGLPEVTPQRTVVLPQLSAPGVAAHTVKRQSGFRVIYGPIRADDIPEFLDSGLKATTEMRQKTFSAWERAVLIPVELVDALKTGLFLAPALFLLGGLGGPGPFWANAWDHGLFAVLAVFAAIAAGAIAAPILLPWLPGRAFSVKGLFPGLLAAAFLAFARRGGLGHVPEGMEVAAWCLVVLAIASYLAMNFTGASTYTSLSGVRKEMRYAVPCQLAAAVSGMLMWLCSRCIA
jgi:hypothetical protein